MKKTIQSKVTNMNKFINMQHILVFFDATCRPFNHITLLFTSKKWLTTTAEILQHSHKTIKTHDSDSNQWRDSSIHHGKHHLYGQMSVTWFYTWSSPQEIQIALSGMISTYQNLCIDSYVIFEFQKVFLNHIQICRSKTAVGVKKSSRDESLLIWTWLMPHWKSIFSSSDFPPHLRASTSLSSLALHKSPRVAYRCCRSPITEAIFMMNTKSSLYLTRQQLADSKGYEKDAA